MDCFRCSFNYIEVDTEPAHTACRRLLNASYYATQNSSVKGVSSFTPGGISPDEKGFSCYVPHFKFIDQSKYAAQLAWWLLFFPPERFLIVSSWQLRDPYEAAKVTFCTLTHFDT
jgi:hypothetical protein